ncbi:MAG: hypothetical protein CBC73_03445 [Flavobacteriales bacterium TMED113]|nr:MAG: hypothetical protein CBC73_03445 [Flavobacteriales bacterium TMED113]
MNNLFKKISNKVELLINSYQKLSKENRCLLEERNNLLAEVKNLKNEINDLQKNLERIKISSSLENQNQDNILARKKINMFLREIDKCIKMLSN